MWNFIKGLHFSSSTPASRASGGISGGIRGDGAGGSGVTQGQKGKHLKTGKGGNWVGERLCRSDERTEGPAADGDGGPVMAHLSAPEDSCSQWMTMLPMASGASRPEGTLCPQAQADSTGRSGRKELGSRKYPRKSLSPGEIGASEQKLQRFLPQ